MKTILLSVTIAVSLISCSQSFVDEPTRDPKQIDSIIVRDGSLLELTIRDTVSLEVAVFPASAELDENQLFLLKKDSDNTLSRPLAYKITRLEKTTDKNNNSYILYIADTDEGHGYIDSVQICYQNTGYVIKSKPFVIKNAGTSLFSFTLSDGTSSWESFYMKNDTLWIQVPNTFNLKAATASFSYNGEGVYLNNVKQQNGKGNQDYSDFCKPLEYVVRGFDGNEQHYIIEVFNLPIIFINTPDSVDITSRYEWLGSCSFAIRDTDGTIEDYGETNVKGRGNWTWRAGIKNGKKPYAIKFANKPKDRKLLGMPGHKRWVLLANPYSYLPNPIGYEIDRRTETCKWAPHSRFVELVLNGRHQGLYLFGEQIKIDKNRVNINEMKATDISGEALTGGYLISYDDADEDDDPTYRTQYYNMPFMIKNPDTEDIRPEQLEYITNYLNNAELSLFDEEKFNNNEFYNYYDIDSWIDYFFVEELWGALEMWRPRSIWLYKDRGGKLTAGPVWDLESNYFYEQKLYCTTSLYYGRFLKSSEFVERMKAKWGKFRSIIVGDDNDVSIIEYIDSLYNECHNSADRDRKMTPSEPNRYLPGGPNSTIDIEYQVIRDNILEKLNWLEDQIMSW